MRNSSAADATPSAEPADLTGRRWSFGPAVLDERSLQLEVDGEPVPLERKPLEVLLYLLHHTGEVVTQDDLAENLWPGRILTDSVLTRCISVLRQALKDDGKLLIRTVHGYGYRLVADVRVESSPGPAAPPALDFKVGDHPPLRPQWKLVERLGTGGHGEAWLARHEKTGDARVFKFALDASALTALKREITLYRLLHDSLGARAAIARIYEWNLSEPPYFIEMEHVAGGNLQAWSDAQGGLASVPLATRLELAAQITDALAAAHSVGALHKDLKPANVLIQVDDGKPTVRLCDFGSGGVLDHKRLEQLGITRLGFTTTLADENVGGTPLYLAPEVVSGQPFTVQSDIYALGVLLYQLVTGESRKAPAPGWENDVADELLREDIAIAAAGNPARRLTDAAQLAERLRTLDVRHEAREAELLATQKAERARRIQGALRRTRVFALLLLGLTGASIAVGMKAYRARNEALVATASAKAIGDFLMEDVFRLDSGLFKPSEASYEALLGRAAEKVGTRLQHQPEAAGSIHWMLGQRYQEIGQFRVAVKHYERAVELLTKTRGNTSEDTLLAQDRLAWIYLETGSWAEALKLSEQVQQRWKSSHSEKDLPPLLANIRRARVLLTAGDYAAAEMLLRDVLRSISTADASGTRSVRLLKQWLGADVSEHYARDVANAYAKLVLGSSVLEEFSEDYAESESLLRAALSGFSATVGDNAELSALASLNLGIVLSEAGKTREGEKLVVDGGRLLSKNLPARHYGHGVSNWALARVRVEQQRFSEASRQLREAADLCEPESGCPPRIKAEFLLDFGMALNEGGLGATAIPALRSSLEIKRKLFRQNHIGILHAEIALAEALRQAGKFEDAYVLYRSAKFDDANLKPDQRIMAFSYRLGGLLALRRGNAELATEALTRSLDVLNRRLGPNNWRTQRARAELSEAVRDAGSGTDVRYRTGQKEPRKVDNL